MTRRDQRRAQTGALAASVLVHLVLFAWLALQAAPELVAPPPTATPDFQVELGPLPPSLAPPPRPAAAPAPTASRAPRRGSAVQRQASRPPPRRLPGEAIPARSRPAPPPALPPAPSTPARATANIAAPAAPAPPPRGRAPTPWAVEPDDGQDGVRGFLRATVGCSHEDYLHLNDAERAACDRRLGREGRDAAERVDALSAEARGAFDAAVAARERARANGTGPIGSPVIACRGPGSNMDRGCLNLKTRRPDDGP